MSKAERTKQYIIEKTAPVFNTKGYAGTSLNDIMEATGLTKGSIYGNFENKDEIALAAFDYNFQSMASYIKSKMYSRTSSIDKLMVYPEIFRDFLKLPFLRGGCPVLNTSTEADDTHPLLREKAINALAILKGSLERLLVTGIEKKEIRSSVNVNEFAIVFISLLEGGVMQAKVTGKIATLSITMNYLEKMILELKS